MEEEIKNLNEYNDCIREMCQDGKDYEYFFRGENNDKKNIKNMPSVFCKDSLLKDEHILIKKAILHFPEIYNGSISTFQKLVRMRHYELPVRLLDITSSPLVSLYFACTECNGIKFKNEKDKDGFVYVFKEKKSAIKYYDSDTVCVLSNLAHMNSDFDYNQRGHLLHKIKEERPDFYDLFGKNQTDDLSNLNKYVCVIPQYNNDRIKVQQGAFYLFGLKDGKKSSFAADHYSSIRIPYSCKKDIIENLKLLGYEHSKLFPDELEIFRTLKQQYK